MGLGRDAWMICHYQFWRYIKHHLLELLQRGCLEVQSCDVDPYRGHVVGHARVQATRLGDTAGTCQVRRGQSGSPGTRRRASGLPGVAFAVERLTGPEPGSGR